MSRTAYAPASVALIGLAIAVGVQPATGEPAQSGSNVYAGVPLGGEPTVYVDGSPGKNDVSIRRARHGRIRVTDASGVTAVPFYPCEQVSSTTALCRVETAAPELTFLGHGGDDEFFADAPDGSKVWARGGDFETTAWPGDNRFELAVDSTARAQFYGSRGSDTLIGGAAGDFLNGARGPDRLVGRGGADELWGAKRKDVFIGGAGRDTIYAIFKDTDVAIRCGAGRDKAVIDRDEDPQPKGCEEVLRIDLHFTGGAR